MSTSSLSRRRALQLLAGAGVGSSVATATPAGASAAPDDAVAAPDDAVAMLFDTTRCIGCKACMAECNRVNGIEPDTGADGLWQMPLQLNARTPNIIQLLASDAPETRAFVKRQCMHCVDPACVAGCPFGALEKGDKGIVIWKGDQCIGCRFCEVACPFEIPKFEWDQLNPRIVKCEFCAPRLAEGLEPGCTTVCPVDAIVFGTRRDLLEDAHTRLAAEPDKYHEQRVYGEHEGGGTQVLYVSHVPFADLGLPDLPRESNARFASRYQHLLYKAMIVPTLLYGALSTVIRRRWRHHEAEQAALRAEQDAEGRGGLREQL
jgi:formate dehydrogenase beta subunit